MTTATAVTPGDIWNALLANGASAVQAAAIMGNMMAESSLNPESAAKDSNGAYSYGLNQWNAASYPGASALVTGNPVADLQSQIQFLAHTGGFAAASGPDPATAASNFAHNYERCAACGYQGGSSQLSARAANAQAVAAAAQSGNWTTIGSSATVGTADLTSATGGQGITIPNPLDGGLTKITIVSASQIRTIKAYAFIGVGGWVMILGFGVILAAGVGRTGLAEFIPGGGPVKAIAASRRSGGQSRAAPRQKRPDEDDRLAEKAAADQERTAARTGKTQAQRYRDAQRRSTRNIPGPANRRGYEKRSQASEEKF